MTRAWLAWWAASMVVGYAVAVALAIAFPNAVVEVALLAFGAAVAWAVARRLPYFRGPAVLLVGWWGFGAWVNGL